MQKKYYILHVQTKQKSRGFSLIEILFAVVILGIFIIFGAGILVSSWETEKKLGNRLDLVDLQQRITGQLDCLKTLGANLPVPCSGQRYILKNKLDKEILLDTKYLLRPFGSCQVHPISGEKGIIIGVVEGHPGNKIKKRAKLVYDDIFSGNASFCGRYFEPPIEKWELGGIYTVNTGYDPRFHKNDPNLMHCSKGKIDAVCDGIFGGNCQAECSKAYGDCRNDCVARYPPRAYSCNCTPAGACQTCYDHSEQNACFGRCADKQQKCKTESCDLKLNECKEAYNNCQAKVFPCRHKNPVTGDCTCPSVGGSILEVREQISWSMDNSEHCDYGFYSLDKYPITPWTNNLCEESGSNVACFRFEVQSHDPDSDWVTKCRCKDDNGNCPSSSLTPTGPLWRQAACTKGSLKRVGSATPAGGPADGSPWFGCGIKQITCLVKKKVIIGAE